MEYRFSNVTKCPELVESGLCEGIPLLLSKEATLADLGAVKAQEDWRRHVGPIESYRGGMGPEISYIPAIIPECLPDRLEVIGYANEFGFMHDDLVDNGDKHTTKKENNELLDAFKGRDENAAAYQSGKTHIQSHIMLRMLAIDRPSALASIKAGAQFVQSTINPQDPAAFGSLDEYLDFRVVDFGQMFWQALITFGMGLCIPENEQSLCIDLCRPAWVAAALSNDLYSWDRELRRAQDLGQSQVMNGLWVLVHKNCLSIEKAKAVCRATIKDSVVRFLQVIQETKIRTDVSNDLKVYVEALQYFVSGNLAWSLTCPKYDSQRDFNQQQREWLKVGVPESLPSHEMEKFGISNGYSKKSARVKGIVGDAISAVISVSSGHASVGNDAASNDHTFGSGSIMSNCSAATNGDATSNSTVFNGHPVVSGGVMSNGQDISTSQVLSNGYVFLNETTTLNGLGALEERSVAGDETIHDDILFCNLTKISKEIIEAPAKYIQSMPSKGVRSKVIDGLNLWLKVSPEALHVVKKVTDLLHTASLMLDDFQDGSNLRRGKPSTHTIFGAGPTVNSAFFQFVLAVKEIEKLNNAKCREVLLGQSLDLDWTSNLRCPSIEEYLRMVDFTQKGFAEDLDEGKYSLPLIHALQSLSRHETVMLRNLLSQRRVAGCSPLIEHKTLILELMKQAGSLEFTERALRKLMGEIESDMRKIEEQAGENLQLRVMAMLLAI
ncbi:geranylgeranyl diphosphate synthase [Stemphylium lycopersici]|uniref:geranylgeranyl diphosphate synthase n=1 Tax=Stemphylium lycopersici TaxID=183478 RepID=A0A364MRX5_STELY|nr:geranylgeranyl diphosphate synthase [Stemphylium lycopersici]